MFKKVILPTLTSSILLSSSAFSKEVEGTGLFLLEMGQSFSDGDIDSYLSAGASYRMKIFGGMKLDVPYISAAGLGLDFTYSTYKLKDGYTGRYNKYSWDMFHLPLSWGFFTLTPGFSWNVVDVKINEIDVSQITIRPSAIIDAGLSVAVAQRFALNVNVRYEALWNDFETTNADDGIDITGNHYQALFGASTYF